MRAIHYAPGYRPALGFSPRPVRTPQPQYQPPAQEYDPAYNLELISENHYRISLAVLGFKLENLSLEMENQTLTITGRADIEGEINRLLHQGFKPRNFSTSFQLKHGLTVAVARLKNGILQIDLQQENPETAKAINIPINRVGSEHGPHNPI